MLKRSASDGLLGIDFDIFGQDGNRVATVRRGVIVQGNEKDYEIQKGMDRYAVTEKATGRVVCDIRKRSEAGNAELEVSVKLYTADGFLIDATPEETNIGGTTFRNNTFANCRAAIAIQ